MALALVLGRRGLGNAWPNPAVGCVLVRDGRIVGRGWTQPGGRPHAEVHALLQAGEAANGATAYVTLEPCAHYGHTAPCTHALIAAGVRRVVLGAQDPDPRVDGKGIAQLRQARIHVITGVLARECAEANAGFFQRVRDRRPLVTLKLATSLDGRIATSSGESKWITNEQARAQGQALRARHDAILIGMSTALADDPLLTCRLPGLEARSPVRVVLDSRLRLPLESRLVASARSVPLWLVTVGPADPDRHAALTEAGAQVVEVSAGAAGRTDMREALAALAARGVTRLLIEGGGEVAASALRAGLVDAVAHFQAPLVLGQDGRPGVQALGLNRLADAPRFVQDRLRTLVTDIEATYIRAAGRD
ncbi:bifunctional diaminohydroxyphosphoribosylaminopyrimidine deaminase/5-amino-6-(5-phosphoribosylamino)uracil reductase RibD [Marinivivus vitaminiproducens]|uniref:bifunctional diaminohydroxyphosphoribosylaminopyrimidine deaminase/5-amino-6-(5-phosphoribosylamino)uracil reductase RibD n=1 Tax=Marinivivus vitaminiproducens TaxID=3035935 RepID=UPI0027A587C1|nr:bifunctional diaminohydroxyphosphoribosylaminopyrimidine deaminase/5-amino-6-(5-phosphoribosylamino)uracil reductase RibD [Geminicoccaceae bacterium SCSIO 64248]